MGAGLNGLPDRLAATAERGLPAALPAIAQWTLVPMPPSKIVEHPDYDDRMEQIVRGLVAGGPDIDVRLLLRQRASMAAAHESDARPTVEETSSRCTRSFLSSSPCGRTPRFTPNGPWYARQLAPINSLVRAVASGANERNAGAGSGLLQPEPFQQIKLIRLKRLARWCTVSNIPFAHALWAGPAAAFLGPSDSGPMVGGDAPEVSGL